MADPTTREVAPPPALPPPRWRAGFLYGLSVPIVKRPGTEVFQAQVMARGRGALKLDKPGAGASVDLLRLD